MRLRIMFVYKTLNIYGVKKYLSYDMGRIVWNDCWLFIFLTQAIDSSKSPVNIDKIRRHHVEEDRNFASQYISKC